ncbi:MAG TPA: acetylornithine deacetylase [Pyrinomonadaceae bacterium]|jgi:acetylornithine deacetylase|nr:acetylornithine deacetylase [Pyrinomonadaceae bacterium]
MNVEQAKVKTVEQTLAELVAIDSRSSLSNVEVVNYASARLEASGLCVRLFPYTDEAGVKKFNLVAVAPRETKDGDEVELALVGHTDTVPFDPAWREATTLTGREGKLYGRGACDTKGYIAAALTAVEHLDLSRLARPLAVVLTADEEIGCLGAKRLADARVLRVRRAIVGEPTSLQPIRAGKGYCLAEIIVGGREGHSAYPALGASAIFRAARLVARIEEMAVQLQREQHAAFDPPHTTVNVGLIGGGTAKNIIAGECRFTLEWRPVAGQPATHVVELVERAVADLRAADADFACEIKVIRLDESNETPAAAALVRALEEATGRSAGAVSFGTEAPQMVEMGAEAVVFGPGDIRVAHRTGEFVPVAELNACVSILSRMIERFCMDG